MLGVGLNVYLEVLGFVRAGGGDRDIGNGGSGFYITVCKLSLSSGIEDNDNLAFIPSVYTVRPY